MQIARKISTWRGKSGYRYRVVAYGDYYAGMFATPRVIGYLANAEVQLGIYGSTNFIASNATLATLDFVFSDAEAKSAYGERQTVAVRRAGAGGRIVESWNNPDFYVDTHRNDDEIPSEDPLMLSIGDVPDYKLCLLVKIEEEE